MMKRAWVVAFVGVACAFACTTANKDDYSFANGAKSGASGAGTLGGRSSGGTSGKGGAATTTTGATSSGGLGSGGSAMVGTGGVGGESGGDASTEGTGSAGASSGGTSGNATGGSDATAGSGGAPLTGLGLPCTSGSDCVSELCVDGVCCESACTGACEACGEADNKGKCVPVKGAPRSGHPSCAGAGTTCEGTCDEASRTVCSYPGFGQSCRAASCTAGVASLAAACDGKGACPASETVDCAPNICSGTICAGGCSDALPCTGSNYCSAGKCTPKKANGQACQTGGECANGSCADGYCCNTSCVGACTACNLSGLLGTCSPVKSAIDDSCKGTQACNATGACKKANGQSCSVASECGSGACVDGYCCGVSSCGTCQACTGSGGACVAVKSVDDPDSCTSASTCDAAGACKTKTGQSCTTAAQCLLGNCVDGVCCSSACNGSCQVCNGTTPGTCTIVTGSPRAGHPACSGSGACAGSCTGAATCTLPATSTVCRSSSCSAGTATNAAYCTSAGACPNAMTTPCGAFTCNGNTSCYTTCTSASQCAANSICNASGICTKCASGESVCGNQCVNSSTNDKACGASCTSCSGSTPSCVNGSCSCRKKADTNLMRNPGLDVSASQWVLNGGAAYSADDHENCLNSGSVLLLDLADTFNQCITSLPSATTFYFGYSFKAYTDGETGACSLTYYADTTCTNRTANLEQAATTAGPATTTSWVSGSNQAAKPSDARAIQISCSTAWGRGYFDKFYLRTSVGGF